MPKTTNFTDPKVISEYSTGTLIRFHLDIPETLRMLGDINQKKILDLGCGDGQFTHTLKILGANPTGVDISEEMLEKAINRYVDIPFVEANGADLACLQSNTFDVVVMRNVLLNVNDQNNFVGIFHEVGRVLKNGGYIILSNPHPASIKNHRDLIWEVSLPEGGHYLEEGMHYHIKVLLSDLKTWMHFDNCHWTIESIMSELLKNDFRITEVTTPIPPPEKRTDKCLGCFFTTPHLVFIKAQVEKDFVRDSSSESKPILK